jgi:O-antigen/teichoic acid export membrane protein
VTSRQERHGLASTLRHLVAGRNSFFFGLAVVLPRVTGLLTLPIYTRLLGPEDFGRYELLTSIGALLYATCVLGLDYAISVRFYRHEETARRGDAASAVAVAASASVITAGLLASLAVLLGPVALQSPDGALPFAIIIVAVPFNVIGGVLAMSLRLRFMGRAFLRAMLGGAFGGTAIGLFLVVVAHLGLVGAALGLASVHVITFSLLALGLRGHIDPREADRSTAVLLIRLGAPLVPAGTAMWVFAVADRFFVAGFLGFTQLGLYASAARLATVLVLVQFGFLAAWGPIALRWGNLADRDRRYAASLRLVAIVGGALIAVVSWLAQPLLWLLAGPDYVPAYDVVWLLTASVLFSAMFFVAQIGANLAQRGSRVALATIIAAVVNTVGNIILIPRLGYIGAGIATLAAYAVAYVVMYAMSQRVIPISIQFWRATSWAIGWTVVAGLSVVASPEVRPWAALVVCAGAIIAAYHAVARIAPIVAAATPTTDAQDVTAQPHPSDVGLLP